MLEKALSINNNLDTREGSLVWLGNAPAAVELQNLYTVGQIRRYKGTLYKCVQAHTSQADWTPDTAHSLWSKTSDPAEEWPEWVQPIGAHDAYSLGAKVSHKEKHWKSIVANNVWEPGVYGWEEVKDDAV